MIFLVQFGINEHYKLHTPLHSYNFGRLWKNVLVLIYSKLHSKSCHYLYLSGSLRRYDGNCKENVTLKLNFALVKALAIIPCWSRCTQWAECKFACFM